MNLPLYRFSVLLNIMSERWCFVVNCAFVVMLLVGYFPTRTTQAAVGDGQQEQCITSNNKAGYCMEHCDESEKIDLRSATCTNSSQNCCPIATVPSWSRKQQYTECDSNRGYCVKSDMCKVRTFRLRSNRCPTIEEVCCPKSAFQEEPPQQAEIAVTTSIPSTTISSTTTSSVSTTSAVATTDATTINIATSTATTPASTVAITTTPKQVVSSTTIIEKVDSASTTPQPEQTNEDCVHCQALTSSDSASTASTESQRTTATTTEPIPLTTAQPYQQENVTETVLPTSLDKNDFLENTIDTPSGLTPSATVTSNTMSPLLANFDPDNFSYKTCGKRNPNGVVKHTISQDYLAEYGEFPWMVALLELPEKRYCCNGALIDKNAILTTAHCAQHCGEKVAIRVGEWNMSSTADMAIPRKDIEVKQKHIHSDFTFALTTLNNNIAVLELKESVEYQPTIQPVCLPSAEYTLNNYENLIATGWGDMVAGNASSNKILKRLDLQHVARSICDEKLKKIQSPFKFNLHHSCVCADINHRDKERPCERDAGSPVVVQIPNTDEAYYLYGLVSWGYSCNQKRNTYTVLTDVGLFRDWIDDTLQVKINKTKNRKGIPKGTQKVRQ